jgi:UDP-N-acetylmuramoyl-L-alanyl-D-glutamate--2,6-diaminopimelate ligase
MEVSSHALAQRRAYAVSFDVVVFTNLTQDHLDYHGTMERYLDAKLMLFDGRNGAAPKGPKAAIVNADDPASPRIEAAARAAGWRILRHGFAHEGRPPAGDLDLSVEGARPGPGGLDLRIRGPGGESSIGLRMIGLHNGANAAAAILAADALGIDARHWLQGLESLRGVPGRLEVVHPDPLVVVDYAHTPDALERALRAMRQHARGHVLLVFGCGGDRDRGKRPLMGAAAAAGADRVWVTNDNPRSEDPEAIARDITAGAPAGALEVVLDRRDAIGRAIAAARPGDAVLVAGKGHETTQTIGDAVLPFDDRAVARELLGGGRP